MKNFTKANVKSMRVEIQKALDKIAKKHDIKIQLGNIRFDAGELRSKIICNIGTVDDVAVRNWEKHCLKYDFGTIHFGAKIDLNGEIFTIAGLNHRAKKYPIIIEKQGKTFKIGALTAKKSLVA